MNTLKNFLLCFVLINLSNAVVANETTLNFSKLNIQEARKKASEEGKLLFVDFHAAWCTPCKWMDQTTFADQNIINLLNDDFISLKVDIDQMEGFEIKKLYEVKYLPTILIFNSEGIMVERIEQTMTPRALKEVLNKHNEPNNKKIVKYEYNTSPDVKNKIAISNHPEVNKLVTPVSNKQLDYASSIGIEKVFKLQIGVFEKFEFAEKLVENLRNTFMEPVNVKNDMRDDKIVFRVCLGQFHTYDDAENFKKTLLEEYNIKSIVL